KGVGALYVRRCEDIVVEAQMHGGGHERGMRSGTLATHQIAGFGLAAELAAGSLSDEQKRISALREKFWQGLQKIGGVQLNGSFGSALPSILNVTFSEVDGESLLLSLQSLAISTGSACTSASIEPSYVLRAMGVSKVDAHASLRFSLGRYTKAGDIDKALAAIKAALRSLRPSFVAS
ncbi:MAG: cysteine desulfurase, partial [Flavobacteriales bacterium]